MCPAGFYCPPGSSSPTPCDSGTFGNGTGLASAASCELVTVGFWAPTGSALPKACPASGFYCPGAEADTVTHGAEPIIVTVGSTTEVETEVVEEVVTEEQEHLIILQILQQHMRVVAEVE